ncbi:MAG TPA: STAS/SEC14 domain-containing protein, partial [Candidatus Baltobacteraceae bacterium]|nr:STAS/SEC14 domain-containing protein [Candidatus Baltobacteraceae bacterium]
KLTADSVAQLAQRLDGLIAERGRIRLMIDLTGFGGWENMEALGAHMDQLKFLQQRIQHIDRIAVIAGYPWQHQLFDWISNVVHTQAKVFDKGQDAAATEWLLK